VSRTEQCPACTQTRPCLQHAAAATTLMHAGPTACLIQRACVPEPATLPSRRCAISSFCFCSCAARDSCDVGKTPAEPMPGVDGLSPRPAPPTAAECDACDSTTAACAHATNRRGWSLLFQGDHPHQAARATRDTDGGVVTATAVHGSKNAAGNDTTPAPPQWRRMQHSTLQSRMRKRSKSAAQ
jgi:hypothetical protein